MTEDKDVENNKAMAAIAYIGILFLVPLLAAKNSPFAQFHAKQGLVLFLAGIAIGFVAWIPFLGWMVGFVGWILLFVLFVIGLMNALNGKKEPLPIIGSFADKFNI